MPPNFRRFLPLILIAVFLLVLLPNLLHKKSGSGPSASTRATQTLQAMSLIDQGEKAFMAANGRYTPHLADVLTPRLATDLTIGLNIDIDVSTDGQRYLARVVSDVLSLVRGRNGAKLDAQSCLVLSSSSGVSCTPAKPKKK